MAIPRGDDDDHLQSVLTALQIVSGIIFFFQAFYLIMMNSGFYFSRIMEVSTERRLTMACYIMALVSVISCFMNLFQISELDDVHVPHSDNYILDLCRPLEWLTTCPFLQLALVISGGVKIPQNRMIIMPALAVGLLLLGLPSSVSERGFVRAIFYILSCIAMAVLFYYNRQQIIEVTNGEEGLLFGSSRFRKTTVALICTWLPFPVWFVLTPEGFGWITDPVVVHVGWGVLNVVAKVSYSHFVQCMKNAYMKELRGKAAAGNSWSEWKCEGRNRYQVDDDVDVEFIASDVLQFLGIKHKLQDLLEILKNANVTTTKELDTLDEVACQEALLPMEVIYVMQQRLRAYRYGFAEQGAKSQANSNLSYAIAEARGSLGTGSAEKLRGAISDARMAGADKRLLENAQHRVEELYGWQAVREYIVRHMVAVMEKGDEGELRDALNVAEMAGLGEQVTLGKVKLAEKDEGRRKIAKYIQIGNTYFRQKKYEEAVKSYDQALDGQIHKDPKTLLNRANCHRMLADWGAAEEDVNHSLELRPNSAPAWRCKALLYQRVEKFQEALAACETGLSYDPKDPILIKVMAAVQLGKNQIEETVSETSATPSGNTTPRAINPGGSNFGGAPEVSPRAMNDFPAPTPRSVQPESRPIGNESSKMDESAGLLNDRRSPAPSNPMFIVPPDRKLEM